MDSYSIALIPGDGIGPEVVEQALRVLETAGRKFNFSLACERFPWNCEYYLRHGEMMPVDGLEQLAGFDAIFLSAVGFPGVPDHISLWGLLLPIRRGFKQYVNLRPIKLFSGISSPLRERGPDDIDMVVVRENNEGEYSQIGGRLFEGTEEEMVVQQTVFTRKGVDRILRYAYELAGTRPDRHLTSATKSNGIFHTMPFWDERFRALSMDYPDIRIDQFHIDILTANLVMHPDWFDVIVGSNLFGDILSDLAPALAGGIGIAPSANINPEGAFPSMFEPVHGSAPDIAGKGIANPVAQIWSGAMMLNHLGKPEAGKCILDSIQQVLAEPGLHTRDLGGSATTAQVGKAIAQAVETWTPSS